MEASKTGKINDLPEIIYNETIADNDFSLTPFEDHFKATPASHPKKAVKIASNPNNAPRVKKTSLKVNLNLEQCLASTKPYETYVLQLVSCFQSLRDVIKDLPHTASGLESSRRAIKTMTAQIDKLTTGQGPLGNDLLSEARAAIENIQGGSEEVKRWSTIFAKCSRIK